DQVIQSLPDGLVLRTARPSDLDQIAALLTERGELADAVDHRLVVEDEDAGWDTCAVVVDGDRVVSTVTLLDETLFLGEVPIPAGQVELVATDREYEGRGLVRALMQWAHDRSASRGHLVQVMIGIPYFYRQFGYQYAIPIPAARDVRALPPSDGDDLVRAASADDIGAMAVLQDAVQRGYDVRMPHTPACWRWLVARDGSSQLIVERDGKPVATGRITPPEDGEVVLGEIAAVDPAAAGALLGYASTHAGAATLKVMERPGHPTGDALERYLAPPRRQAARYYVRVPDVAALLEHVRPVLSARLADSDFAEQTGEVIVSFFRYHVRMAFTNGKVGEPRPGGAMQAPASVGGAGVAPDLTGSLLFGPEGITGLAEVHADVYCGPNEALMSVLFPPVQADLLTFYLP
ncbi:MAG TPA: GNAT family N-acetyltransferase, partial [Streptosporangiaceae bacterium]